MAQIEETRVNNIIQVIAEKEQKTPEEVWQAMQEALDAAWAATWTPGNICAQLQWQCLFPGPRKPTVEEFIIRCSAYIA